MLVELVELRRWRWRWRWWCRWRWRWSLHTCSTSTLGGRRLLERQRLLVGVLHNPVAAASGTLTSKRWLRHLPVGGVNR